jgi:hypothetical protein
MGLFRTSQKKPLSEAADHLQEAMRIVEQYQRDKQYKPAMEDLKQVKALSESLFLQYSMMNHLNRCLQQRYRGEREGSSRHHEPEVFHWHYPP